MDRPEARGRDDGNPAVFHAPCNLSTPESGEHELTWDGRTPRTSRRRVGPRPGAVKGHGLRPERRCLAQRRQDTPSGDAHSIPRARDYWGAGGMRVRPRKVPGRIGDERRSAQRFTGQLTQKSAMKKLLVLTIALVVFGASFALAQGGLSLTHMTCNPLLNRPRLTDIRFDLAPAPAHADVWAAPWGPGTAWSLRLAVLMGPATAGLAFPSRRGRHAPRWPPRRNQPARQVVGSRVDAQVPCHAQAAAMLPLIGTRISPSRGRRHPLRKSRDRGTP